MSDDPARDEHEGRVFRRKLIWLAAIKIIVLVLIGLFIAFYVI